MSVLDTTYFFASPMEFVAEVHGDRFVPIADHVIPETDPGVDQNRSAVR